jgi:hypothetical protein
VKAVTWTPGTNQELDILFDTLREVQYQDKSHRLWKNYGLDSFKFAVALSIVFDDNGQPEACSSIASRECWPANTYRISNRHWKCNNKLAILKSMTPGYAAIMKSQIEWLENNTSYKMYFVSRETSNWMKWGIEQFATHVHVTLRTNNNKYLTCPNECDDSCWQHIIYSGDETILEQWQHR